MEQEIAAGSVHIAFAAPDRETVGAFHAAAVEAGGVDNGRPGLRPHYHSGYYAAFVLDPDGNNVELSFTAITDVRYGASFSNAGPAGRPAANY
jgi:hypothetical protein